MQNLLEFESWIGESVTWTENGCVLIKGKPLEDGKSFLFLAKIKNLQNLARMKRGSNPGMPVNMAILYPEIWKVGFNLEKKLVAKKVMPSLDYLQKFVGISDFKVGLNQNKTPNWRNTINQSNIRKVLDETEYWIQGEDWAEIPVFNP